MKVQKKYIAVFVLSFVCALFVALFMAHISIEQNPQQVYCAILAQEGHEGVQANWSSQGRPCKLEVAKVLSEFGSMFAVFLFIFSALSGLLTSLLTALFRSLPSRKEV